MDGLSADDLVPTGGAWSGLLFENSATGYPLTLSWTFRIDFADLECDGMEGPSALTVDWVPASGSAWNGLEGRTFAGSTFGEPIEASLYLQMHHRFDQVRLDVVSQRSGILSVEVHVAGDVDGLGIDELSTSATLRFEGIYVQCEAAGVDPTAAAGLLSRFTALDGLLPRPRGHNVLFELPG